MAIDYSSVAARLDEVCAQRDLRGFYEMISPWFGAIETLGENIRYKEIALPKSTLSLEDMQTLALEFYEALGLDFEEKISRVIMDKNTVFRTAEPTNKEGVMAVGTHELKDGATIIEVDLHPKNNINGVVTVAHEFGHILEQRFQEKMHLKTDCLGEVETMFFEQIFIDWLYERGKITAEDKEILKQKRVNNLDAEIGQLIDEKEILDTLGNPISAEKLKEFDEMLTKDGDVGKKAHFERQIEAMISRPNSNGEYKFRYVFGEIVARALYEDFQTKPQETLQRLNRFLEHSAEYDFGMRQNGGTRTASQINNEQIKTCMSDLLGENYLKKISRVISPQQSAVVHKEKK